MRSWTIRSYSWKLLISLRPRLNRKIKINNSSRAIKCKSFYKCCTGGGTTGGGGGGGCCCCSTFAVVEVRCVVDIVELTLGLLL